jgi:hypothetical protein
MTIATKGGGLIVKDGKFAESCSCCAPPAGFVGLTLDGFKNFLHGYNSALSFNQLSQIPNVTPVGPYVDDQPTALARATANYYSNSSHGPACHNGSEFSFFNKICHSPLLTFTSTEVRLYLKLTVHYNDGGGSPYTCEVEYRKPRASFWENKYSIGVFLFTPADIFSFSSDSDKFVQADIGTAAIVQRAWPLGQGISFLSSLQHPFRVEITAGPADLQGTYEFLTPSSYRVGTNDFSGFGSGIIIRETRFFDIRLQVSIPTLYWEAFSSGGALTVSGVGKEYMPWPGAAANSISPIASTVIFTQL